MSLIGLVVAIAQAGLARATGLKNPAPNLDPCAKVILDRARALLSSEDLVTCHAEINLDSGLPFGGLKIARNAAETF